MGRYARALSAVVTVILRSLFLYGFSKLRRGSISLSIVHVVLAVIGGLASIELLVLYTIPIAILYTALRMHILLLYTLTVSSIPGLWMALTQLLLDVAKGIADPYRYLAIYARAALVSLNIMFMLHTLNPTEISKLFDKAKRFSGVYAQLFMRIASFLVKEGIEIVYTHSLKKESLWKTLAILILRGDEIAKGFSEGLIPKYRRYRSTATYDIKTILLQLTIIIYDAILILITATFIQ